jgi:hypothetical protein
VSGSKCQRCGFVDWVEGIQCKQCGLYLDGPEGWADIDDGNRPDPKRLSRFGLALSSLYLLIVGLIVGDSFACGRFGGGERWSAILYCLTLTLTACAFPWPFVLGIILNILHISPGAGFQWVLFPYSIMGIAVNALLLYKFGKQVTKSSAGGRA